MQTQRQLQVSLEAHGQYISSLIEPETTASYMGTDSDSLLEELPPLELAMGHGGARGDLPPMQSPNPSPLPAGPQEWQQGSTWGHSSATGNIRPPPTHFSPVSDPRQA